MILLSVYKFSTPEQHEIDDAILVYKSIKASFSKFTPNKFKNTFTILAFEANGCGASEGGWVNDFIPQEPFREACNSHDVCYSRGESKDACDIAFKYDMYKISKQRANSLSSEWKKVLVESALKTQADTYHFIVSEWDAGLQAYCAANNEATECSPNINIGAGAPISETIKYIPASYGSIIQVRCELWKFRNGKGAYYYIYKNCLYQAHQP
jgi:hypothetical protein